MPQVYEASVAVGSVEPSRIKPPSAPFGYQLLLDLYRCRKGSCDDLSLCYSFLEGLIDILNVEAQSPPFIFRTDRSRYPNKAGLSGWIPLVESGIQIHTLSVKDYISVDVYSCRHFDTEPIIAFVRSYFSPKRVDQNYIERGLEYYK